MEMRLLVINDVCLDVAEGCVGLVLDAVVEGLNDVFLKSRCARISGDYGLADVIGIAVVRQAQHVHLDAGGRQGDYRVHEFRYARRGVQSNAGPNLFNVGRIKLLALQKVTGSIRAVHFEPQISAAVRWH